MNAEAQTSVRKAVVKRGLHSFLDEVGRVSKTSGLHYSIVQPNRYEYVIEHHNGRWTARVNIGGYIDVRSDDGSVLTVDRWAMSLNGSEVDEVCTPDGQCYDTQDIWHMVVFSIALWYWHSAEPDTLRQLAKWL